jgi:hypothetical protein
VPSMPQPSQPDQPDTRAEVIVGSTPTKDVHVAAVVTVLVGARPRLLPDDHRRLAAAAGLARGVGPLRRAGVVSRPDHRGDHRPHPQAAQPLRCRP